MKTRLYNYTTAINIGLLLLSVQAFPSENLVSITNSALLSNPRVSIADYRYQISKNQKRKALGEMLPTINLSASLSDNIQKARLSENRYTGEKYNLALRQPLYNRPALSAHKRTGYEIKQRQLEKTLAISEMILDVAENYLSVLAANDDLILIRSELNTVQEQLKKNQKLYNKNLAKITDLYKIESHVDKVKIQEIEKKNAIQIAKTHLASLTNRPIGELSPLKEDIKFDEIKKTLDFWLKKALSNNLELMSIDQGILAKTERINEIKGERHPTLGLELVSQQSNVAYENARTPSTKTKYAGLVLTMPLYSGGKTSAKIRETSNHLSIAKMERERARQFVTENTRKAYLNLHLSLKKIKSLENSVLLAKKSYKATEMSLGYKVVTTTDLIEALHEKYQAKRDLKDARHQYLNAWLRLLYFSGELHRQKLIEINTWAISDSKTLQR